jgi:double-stranded uracil-DNA glycosylase
MLPAEPKRSFPPVVNADTRVLILGSLPGDASLRRNQYYAHPRNQFWRLLEQVIGAQLVDVGYDERLATLLSAGVGLWDVVRSARRSGSLDANIRDSDPNDLPGLIATYRSVQLIAFNGGKASDLGRRTLGEARGLRLVSLPSSSPACAIPFDRKQAAWNHIRGFLLFDDDASANP